MKVLTVSLLLGLASCALGARILSFVPIPSRSHAILSERLLIELGTRGHEITHIAAMEPSKPIPNTKVIVVPGIRDAMLKSFASHSNTNSSSLLEHRKSMNPWLMMFFATFMTESMFEHILDHPAVNELVKSNQKFDLIFGEIMMDEAILAGLSHKFKAPVVAFATFIPNVYANYLVGNPAPASFISDPFLGYGRKMSFFQRVNNFLFTITSEIVHGLLYLPKQDQLMRRYFDPTAPYIGEILRNTSLVLVNTHHTIGQPRPYNPNMIEVAGVHINPPKDLPKDLKSFMDKSKNGVVYFSLGSNVNSSDLPRETIDGILKGFAKLDEDVIWKFEAELTGLPKNVRTMKWVPQSDILAHPNLKLFITHGGMLSTTEAMSRGVPIVGIPLMGDQNLNMRLTEEAGWGRTLELDDINEDSIYEAVKDVLTNPRYKENAVRKSILLNDNPLPPLEHAVWWIEYIIRHKGAPQLRSGAQDLKWYQYYLLDVYALSLFILIATTYINICVTKTIFKRICRLGKWLTTKKSAEKKKKKKN